MPVVKKQLMTKKVKAKPRRVGFVNQIQSVADLEDTGYKVLIYGLSGTGKTTLGCTFPKPLLMIRPEQVEDGTRSVRTVKGVDVTPFMTTPNQMDELVEYQRETGKYKTIILDGVTKFQDLVLKKTLDLSSVPEQLSWGIANQQTWGIVSNELKEHLRKLLRLSELGVHIVIAGGERSLNVDNENSSALLAPTVMVALTPSSMGWLHEVMDYNVNTFLRRKIERKEITIAGKKSTKEVTGRGCEFCLRVAPDPIYQIKFRVPKGTELPDVMVDPSFDKIHSLIQSN